MVKKHIKFKIDIPNEINSLLDIFLLEKYNLLLVGGCVRDSILGIKPKDWDLVTNATPDEVENILSSRGFKTLPTGKAFGVITVFMGNKEYEIATLRSETYTEDDKRRPNSIQYGSIEDDCNRRDLTINALYYDLKENHIIDMIGGVYDLDFKIIRAVGNPTDRLEEDRLRKIRLVRFAARLGGELEEETHNALISNPSLEGISNEIIRDEFIKGILTAKSVEDYLWSLENYGLFDEMFKGSGLGMILNPPKELYTGRDHVLVLASLLKDNAMPYLERELNKLCYTKEEIKQIKFLIDFIGMKHNTTISLKRRHKQVGLTDEQIRLFAEHDGFSSILTEKFLKFELSIDGNTLMSELGMKAGPELGQLIEKMELENFLKK